MLDKHEVMGPVQPVDRPDHDVDDPLYLMTLTIPQLFSESVAGYVGCYHDWGV